jgi:hypothetical protein
MKLRQKQADCDEGIPYVEPRVKGEPVTGLPVAGYPITALGGQATKRVLQQIRLSLFPIQAKSTVVVVFPSLITICLLFCNRLSIFSKYGKSKGKPYGFITRCYARKLQKRQSLFFAI